MRITLVNTSIQSGGAARACHRLHRALLAEGVASTLFTSEVGSGDATLAGLPKHRSFPRRIRQAIRDVQIRSSQWRYRSTVPPGHDIFSDDRSIFLDLPARVVPPSDVLHLHWVARFVDHLPWFALLASVPMVWTLHDMNPLTGGCHYSGDCGRFSGQCGECPQLGSYKSDLSSEIFARKKAAYANMPQGRMHIVAPSKWMAKQACDSALLGNRSITVIPNAIDTAVFSPQDRNAARGYWGLPLNAKIVSFIAASAHTRRKGGIELAQVLKLLSDEPDILLICAGHDTAALGLPSSTRHLGQLENDAAVSQMLAASDLFLIPSLEDNLPNTVMEAMACGVPVAGFETGGIPDMVVPGTGWLAPRGDVTSLARQVRAALTSPHELRATGGRARIHAVEHYSPNVVASRHIRLYQSLIEAN